VTTVYYIIGTNRLGEAFAELVELLPPVRRQKAESYKKEEDKCMSLAAYFLLLYGLERKRHKYTDLSPSYNSWGKPYFTRSCGVHFNLSHSGCAVACALSEDAVGVDIQGILRIKDSVLKKVCSDEERWRIKVSINPEIDFTRLWTMKESYLKAVGKGITEPLAGVNFMDDSKTDAYRDGYFLSTCITEDYAVTVCCREKADIPFVKVTFDEVLDFAGSGLDLRSKLGEF
jgi:4'-phosphopantetheinyl transferase